MSTKTPTPHTTPTGVRPAVGAMLEHVPAKVWLAVFAVAAVLLAAAWVDRRTRTRNSPRAIRRAVSKGVRKGVRAQSGQRDGAAANGLAALFGLIWRLATGRELRGVPASNATMWHRGRRPLSRLLRRDQAVSQLGTVAIPERALPAFPARPSAAVERWRGWVDQHPLPEALDGAVRRGGSAAVWVGGSLHAGARGVAAAGGQVRGALREWGTWSYAARALVRWAVVVAAFGLWLYRVGTIWALVAALAVALALAATGPAGLGLWRGVVRGDDHRFGPHLWAALRVILDLREEEYHDPFLRLPADLSAEDAAVMLDLPDHYAATDTERAQLDHVVNTRLPGEWVARFHMMTSPPHVVWTHKPKPKPKPEPPDRVGFFDPDIQAAIARCARGEFVIGKDETGRIIVKKLDDETPHWALSVGTGGGKSIFNMMIMAQAVGQGYHCVIPDVKRVSVAAFSGVPGVYIYNDPGQPQDMRKAIEWFTQEIDARAAISEVDSTIEFPGLLLILEEANELADVSKGWWDANRESSDRAADPMWGDVASGARLGRHVHGNIIGVFQDLRDQAMGGKGVRNLFRLKLIGNFTVNTWNNVVGTKPVPDSYEKAGRMMIVEGNAQYWVQTLYADPEQLRDWALAKRREARFDPAAGLYGTPPAPSPKALPALLKAASRDKLPEATWKALEGNLGDSAAGGAVTSRSHDAVRHGQILAQRDASPEVTSEPLEGASDAEGRAILGVYQHLSGRAREAAEAAAVASWRTDATAAETAPEDGPLNAAGTAQMFTLAEIARRFEERGINVKYDTMRQHKNRRKTGPNAFPAGTEVDGKTFYTLLEIVQYYQAEITGQWSGNGRESGR